MKLSILSDVHHESGIDVTARAIRDYNYREYFEARNYGDGIQKVLIGLICRAPELNLKRRIRFSKASRVLSIDVMLDFEKMKASSPIMRKQLVMGQLIDEIPKVIARYDIEDFDSHRFVQDFRNWAATVASEDETK